MEWQPIETAPSRAEAPHGVLVWDGKYCSIVFSVEHDGGRWWLDEYTSEVTPTHWMPLPPPPSPAADER